MPYEPPPALTKEDNSYMPRSDEGKRDWMHTFITSIERSENHFGIPDDEFEQCREAVNEFIALTFKVGRSDRTTALTSSKNQARKKAVQHCRALAMRLKHSADLSAGDAVGLGIHLERRKAAPLSPPQRKPYLKVTGTHGGGHEIRFGQRIAHTTATAKPKGVSHLLVFAAIGDRKLPVSQARLIAGVTRQPYKVDFPVDCGLDGKTITYYGRWMDRKGRMGPWSDGVSMILSRAEAALNDVEFKHLFPYDREERAVKLAA